MQHLHQKVRLLNRFCRWLGAIHGHSWHMVRVFGIFTVACGTQGGPMATTHQQPATPPYATVLMVDGMAQDVFLHELAAGRLPNIQKLIDEGVYIHDGIGAFPSMTGYGFYPYLTGHDAANSGVLGLRWFDRSRATGAFRSYVGRTHVHMNGDTRTDVPTLFEQFPSMYSSSFNSYMNRGAVASFKLAWDFTAAKFKEDHWLPRIISRLPAGVGDWLVPSLQQVEDRVFADAIADLEKKPKIQWLTLASPDTWHHLHGHGPIYNALIRHIDHNIGLYRAASRRLGQEEHRIYLLATDHGVRDVHKNLDVAEMFSQHTIVVQRPSSTAIFSDALRMPMEDLDGADILDVINGNLVTYLYVRHPLAPHASQAWRVRPPLSLLRAYPSRTGAIVDIIAILRHMSGIRLILVRDGDAVNIYRGPMAARIDQTSAGMRYQSADRNKDPFEYLQDPVAQQLVNGQFHSKEAWLQATHRTQYPDAVNKVMALMRQDGAGDIVITAELGSDFGKNFEPIVDNYHGGHGALEADLVRFPIVIAGPGLAANVQIPTARVEDVGVTLQYLLGVDAAISRANTYDGVVLWDGISRVHK